MDDTIEFLRGLYQSFNSRDIDGVIEALAEEVVWANAMEGGHERGRDAVRAYWTRQMSQVSVRVEPISFQQRPDGWIVVEVEQSICDLAGTPLQGQTHGLKDRVVTHRFQLQAGKIVRFDVAES